MKQKIIRILLPILFLMGNCLAAQFNTLTPIISQKIEVLIPDRAGFTEIVDEAV